MDEAEVRVGLMGGVALGLKRANRWSHGRVWPGDTGAENLLQVSVAQKVYGAAKSLTPVIELETTLHRLGIEGDKRRVDLALMRHADVNDRPHPFCIVEIKKAPAAFAGDLRKLEALLRGIDTIRYAFLATYFQRRLGQSAHARPAKTFVRDLDCRIREAALNHDVDCRLVESRILGRIAYDEEGGRYYAGALIHRFS